MSMSIAERIAKSRHEQERQQHEREQTKLQDLRRLLGPEVTLESLSELPRKGVFERDTSHFERVAAVCEEVFPRWRQADRIRSIGDVSAINDLAQEASKAVVERNEVRLREVENLLKQHAAAKRMVLDGEDLS